jgi:2-polyprenyl-6-methoxyphenol hydroxylase-like FAD-dependent oxidoreductase
MSASATQCCIVGGGPAGMMLGFLLARSGVKSVVLEKHEDFLRDFRGDTVHPSTLSVMDELGLLDEFLKLPHQKLSRIAAQFGEERVEIADFSHLPVRSRFIAFMPQWDFLNFLAAQGKRYPAFTVHMRAEATGLIEEGGRVVGVHAIVDGNPQDIRADLVVGADGRHSIVRDGAGLPLRALGAPIDVLWFRLARRPNDARQALGRFDRGSILVLLDRGDYWQCAYVIAKGTADSLKRAGIAEFRARIANLMPILADRVHELGSVDDLKLLSVAVERLEKWWKPGLLCIGDAAHTMSPIAGVGINIAVQDAVAAANLLAAPLKEGRLKESDLEAVQARRRWPVRATQAIQVFLQNRMIAPTLAGTRPLRPPWVARLLNAVPFLRRLPARVIGLGVQPEHVRTKAA